MMTKFIRTALIGVALATSSLAFAQSTSPPAPPPPGEGGSGEFAKVREACHDDVERLCKDVKPGEVVSASVCTRTKTSCRRDARRRSARRGRTTTRIRMATEATLRDPDVSKLSGDRHGDDADIRVTARPAVGTRPGWPTCCWWRTTSWCATRSDVCWSAATVLALRPLRSRRRSNCWPDTSRRWS